jgi:hypothetical protein
MILEWKWIYMHVFDFELCCDVGVCQMIMLAELL